MLAPENNVLKLSSEQVVHDDVKLCSPQSIILLCILPCFSICGFLWVYTALPLAFVDNGWPLWQLSLLLTLVYIPRVICVSAVSRIGDVLGVPLAGISVGLNLYFAYHPDSLAAVCTAVCAVCAAMCPTVHRSLIYKRFEGSSEWQKQRALRIYTLADTLGYGTAPFIGGVLYDNGGLRACALFAVATSSIGLLLPLGLRVWWESLPTAARRSSSAQPTLEAPKSSMAKACEQSGSPSAAVGMASTGVSVCSPAVVVILIAVFMNISVYGVEWCLYALYFRFTYGWSGTWCGLAQMVGDLLGAAILAGSTTTFAVIAAGRVQRFLPLSRPLRAVLRPPYSLTALSFTHASLTLMLAQPHFTVALLGQIFLGTSYVFFEQALQELLLLYARGDHAKYRRLVSLHYLSFTAGCSLCSPLAYGLYEASSFAAAFYATALYACAVGLFCGAFFAARLTRTPGGLFGSLADAEDFLVGRQRLAAVASA